MTDTIAAVATGAARTAIGILRISGPGAIDAASAVFRPLSGPPLAASPDRLLRYGDLVDARGRVLDRVLATVSRAPRTYTGEDTAELQCHGSPAVLAEGLAALYAAGCRAAEPGEFTKRAFLNGRLDLAQAEAVIDLIDAETAEAAIHAAGQLNRAVSRKTDAVYDRLTDILAHFHAVLDYPDEDVDDFTLAQYAASLAADASLLRDLAATHARGRFVRDGVPAAIVGRPNAGKSSLLNALLGWDRAIVTDVPGTTRDTLEEKLRVGGAVLRLTDTAGLRETRDPVEKLGVERSASAAREAHLVLAVLDGAAGLTEADAPALAAAKAAPLAVAVWNKTDLAAPPETWPAALDGFAAVVPVSAKTGAGLGALCETLAALVSGENAEIPAGELLTSARQAEAVTRAADALDAALEGISCKITPDAVLTEVESARSALGEITGRTVREDVTARIFARFCVGK